MTVTAVDVPRATFLTLLPTVRLAETTEWIDLLDRSSRGELPVATQDGDGESGVVSTSIGGRTPQDDESWWLVNMTAGASPWVFINSVSTGWAGPLGDVPQVPTVHPFASSTMTFLIGTVLWTSTATTMRVTVDGQPPVDVPLVEVSKAVHAGAARLPRAGCVHRRLPRRRGQRRHRVIGGTNRSTPTARASSIVTANGRPMTLLTLPSTDRTNAPPAPWIA